MPFDYTSRQFLNDTSTSSLRVSIFNEKDVIFQKGEIGHVMYEVITGSVGIFLNYGKENEILLAEKKPGEYFGEIALIEERPRTATAVAMGDMTKLREVSSNGFIHYVREYPEKLESILDIMSLRFKEQRNEYLEICDILAHYHRAMENYELLTYELSDQVQHITEQAEKRWGKK